MLAVDTVPAPDRWTPPARGRGAQPDVMSGEKAGSLWTNADGASLRCNDMLDDEAIAGALAVTDRFLTTFNDGDARGHAATLAYPHIRLASANVVVWSDIDEATTTIEQALAALRDRAHWDHSEWDH